MEFVSTSSLGIYVHLPFCKNKCGYCHFYTEKPQSLEQMSSTVDDILTESQVYADIFLRSGSLPGVSTFYVGGGTPSILPPQDIVRLIRANAEIWNWKENPPSEVAMEANPENLTSDFFRAVEEAGISRLSVGIQSFHQKTLTILSRNAGSDELHKALDAWHSYPWKRRPQLNLDLILGTPEQTSQELRSDLMGLLAWDPDHVSLYGLSIDEGTYLELKIKRGEIQPLETEIQEDLWEEADLWLEERGWKNYEISNYARVGCESLHNLGYWNLKPYLGLGPGAVGTFGVRSSAGEGRVLRRKNPILKDYHPGSNDFFDHGEIEWVSRAEFFLDHLITGLRLEKGIPFGKLDKIFQVDSRFILKPWLEDLDRKGLLCYDTSKLCLNKRGRFALDRLLISAFDLIGEHPLLVSGPAPNWPV